MDRILSELCRPRTGIGIDLKMAMSQIPISLFTKDEGYRCTSGSLRDVCP